MKISPLRRIVSRTLEVWEWHRGERGPKSFAIHDQLECGHVTTSLTWDLADLTNPYTENLEVRARHHRCHPCGGANVITMRPAVVMPAERKRAA